MTNSPNDEPLRDAEEADEARQALIEKIEAFGNALVKYREEAVQGRKNSGIEQEWLEVEEAYQGIDDANRAQMSMGKPSSPNGGYVNSAPANPGRSTVFMNITRPYVDAAAARVGDMMLPTDDTPWGLKPTKIPNTLPGQEPVMPQPAGMAPGQTLLPPQGMVPQAGAQPGMPGAVPGVPPVPMKPLDAAMDKAKAQAEKATEQIEDWLTECQWHAETRKMIEDAARLGTGILKGPEPVMRTSRVAQVVGGMTALVIQSEIKPASKAISPWKFYPDPGCGENIHDGSYVWEVDSITPKALRELKGLPGYMDDMIDRVLKEGPGGKHKQDGVTYSQVKTQDDNNFEIWYFYGEAQADDLKAAGVKLPEDQQDATVPAIVTMVNNTAIRAALNPLDSGEFPYDVMPWQRRTGMPWGTGVGKQINTPQRMLNAATRNMMDNAGLTAGPQIIIRKGAVTPADGRWTLTPRKIWYVNEGADVNAVNQAFLGVNIPTMQVELNNIIQFALKMAEDVTGMPMMMQGQAGANTPDTVGGMQLVNNNANAVLRRIARMFDDKVTEPHIRRYYQWLMQYSDNEEAKGDFQIDARGSTALVERDIQNQAIMQMGALVMNPAFGIDPEKWIMEALKAQRLDPKRFQLDEQKKAAMAQQPPPVAPQIEAAKIRVEGDLQKTQITTQADLQKTQMVVGAQVQKMQIDTDRDTVYVQAQQARDAANNQAQMTELALKRELALLDYANKRELSLEQVKAELAQTAMKLQTTKELAALSATADRLPRPPVEPPGRAPAGQSYTQ